ncbi:MAG: hypothetical protein V7L29_00870 [Nostoc sp.]|uniref:hypothetical protein n=1 Tax=Nostoc sp. TaxID=1180 RepID=UPI002FFA286B
MKGFSKITLFKLSRRQQVRKICRISRLASRKYATSLKEYQHITSSTQQTTGIKNDTILTKPQDDQLAVVELGQSYSQLQQIDPKHWQELTVSGT